WHRGTQQVFGEARGHSAEVSRQLQDPGPYLGGLEFGRRERRRGLVSGLPYQPGGLLFRIRACRGRVIARLVPDLGGLLVGLGDDAGCELDRGGVPDLPLVGLDPAGLADPVNLGPDPFHDPGRPVLKHRSVSGYIGLRSRTWASRTWARRVARLRGEAVRGDALGGDAVRGVACPRTGSWIGSRAWPVAIARGGRPAGRAAVGRGGRFWSRGSSATAPAGTVVRRRRFGVGPRRGRGLRPAGVAVLPQRRLRAIPARVRTPSPPARVIGLESVRARAP